MRNAPFKGLPPQHGNPAPLGHCASLGRWLLAVLLGAKVCGEAVEPVWPDPDWPCATPAEMGLDETKLNAARSYALSGAGSGCVIRHGRLVLWWGDQRQLYDLKSTTKSFGSVALGLAIKDGKVRLDDLACRHHPTLGLPPQTNALTGWLDRITLLHLASQTAGFEKPGGFTRLLFPPGTCWDYSDSGPNWLAECLTLAYRRDLDEVMFERVFTPLGISRRDLTWRTNAYRPATIEGIPRREFGAGIHATVDACARLGYLMLRQGRWRDRQILSADFARQAPRTPASHQNLPVLHPETYGQAAAHYGLLWWNNDDGTLADVPRDAFWSWGLYDSLIVVVPSLDLLAVRAGRSWPRHKGAAHYDVLRPFLEPLALAARGEGKSRSESSPEQPKAVPTGAPSPVIRTIQWAPRASIIRRAEGSDNWPLTWADDDHLYTAYGDGRGFRPYRSEKLSLALARVEGSPPALQGVNLPAPTLEARGDGRHGPKASGLLMVEGILYLWARNVHNSQLAWSRDHGRTWTWADWKFTRSFGCPTFLNFGRDYAGARDDFVYVYSPDSDDAYTRADRFVLARVPKHRITERAAYEFFVRSDAAGQPVWSPHLEQRGAVFAKPGGCYRCSVSYHPGLKRYLWCQTGPGADTRFAGGFAIYDASEPWGPWSLAFQTAEWDVGPGETQHLPTKWMDPAAESLFMVFSGNDAFSVRHGRLILRDR